MIIKRLDVFIYEESGRGYETKLMPYPGWEEIEAAIRRLDRHRYPFIWLQTDADAADDEGFFLNIMGGEGAYVIEGFPGGKYVTYYDAAGGDEEVDVWTSDQGYSAPGKEVCRDLEIVVAAAKYIYDTGDFDPRVTWKER